MTTVVSSKNIASALRRLYFIRFAFAVVWAVLLIPTASSIGPISGALLVLYPLFDAGAAVVDARASRTTSSAAGPYVNIAISVLAGIGLAVAGSSGVPAVLRVWGSWAVLSGLIQLVLGISRRALGGQWPMIVSGAISVLAGTFFVLQAAKANPSLSSLAGYAILGGIFFLGSALRLGRGR